MTDHDLLKRAHLPRAPQKYRTLEITATELS